MKKYKKGGGISPGLSLALTGDVKSIIGDEKEVMNNKSSKFTEGRNKKRMPMQTGPRKIPGRGPSRIMKPMPITKEIREKMKDRTMKPIPLSPKDSERRKRMKPMMNSGGAAGQTKSTKRPKQSIFQQLKKAQSLRKMGTMGKK